MLKTVKKVKRLKPVKHVKRVKLKPLEREVLELRKLDDLNPPLLASSFTVLGAPKDMPMQYKTFALASSPVEAGSML